MRKLNAIVRVSLNKNGPGNNEVRLALTGGLKRSSETGPFHRRGTAFFAANDEDAVDVGAALTRLGRVLKANALTIDHVFISMAKATHKQLKLSDA